MIFRAINRKERRGENQRKERREINFNHAVFSFLIYLKDTFFLYV